MQMNPYLKELIRLTDIDNPTESELLKMERLREMLFPKPKSKKKDKERVKEPFKRGYGKRIPFKLIWNGGYRIFDSKAQAIEEIGISHQRISKYLDNGETMHWGKFKGFRLEYIEESE